MDDLTALAATQAHLSENQLIQLRLINDLKQRRPQPTQNCLGTLRGDRQSSLSQGDAMQEYWPESNHESLIRTQNYENAGPVKLF
jgi:hypothetical protein